MRGPHPSFVRELTRAHLFDDTLNLTFSEFGRRASENYDFGTDHGKANLAFPMSGEVKSGTVKSLVPDLANLDEGDLAMETDSRSIYATIITRWFGDPHVDHVGDYPLLDFG